MAERLKDIYDPDDDAFRDSLVDRILMDSEKARSLCDTILHTTDQKQVPACRTLLAAQSEYFQALFFSNFKEASQRDVELSVSSSVLHHVLIYAYTGRFPFIEQILNREDESQFCDDEFKLLVEIKAAADCYGMDTLHTWCNSTLYQICYDFPQLACTVLESMSVFRPSDVTRTQVLDFMRINYDFVFNVPERVSKDKGVHFYPHLNGILKLSAQTLHEVLDEDLSAYGFHEFLFECIFFWLTKGYVLSRERCELRVRQPSLNHETVDVSSKHTGGNEEGDEAQGKEGNKEHNDGGGEGTEGKQHDDQQHFIYVDKDRFEWGQKMAARLDLKSMRIRYVHDYVIPTGLIEKIDLMDVLWNYVLSTTTAI